MSSAKGSGLFSTYCYGPVDVLSVSRGSSTMRLRLRDSAGRIMEALYEGCIYWRLAEDTAGLHFPLVRQLSAEELLKNPESVTLRELRKNSVDVTALLQEWASEGLHFFLHYGLERGSEYLVVARKMSFRECG